MLITHGKYCKRFREIKQPKIIVRLRSSDRLPIKNFTTFFYIFKFFSLGPIAGQWGEWGSWGNCQMPPGSSGYGTGTHVRYRACNNPSPICNGDYCVGDDEVTENCRGKPCLLIL